MCGAVLHCHDTVRIRRIELRGDLAEIRRADDVVAAEHAWRLVPAQLHRDVFRRARPHERRERLSGADRVESGPGNPPGRRSVAIAS